MSKKDIEAISVVNGESPTKYKKSSSSIRVRKTLTSSKIIAGSMEFDNTYINSLNKKMESSENEADKSGT